MPYGNRSYRKAFLMRRAGVRVRCSARAAAAGLSPPKAARMAQNERGRVSMSLWTCLAGACVQAA
jgi:hypothetical protein